MSSTIRVLFIATRSEHQPPDSHEGWERAVRRVLPQPDAAPHLSVEFAFVETATSLRAKLREGRWNFLHCYEHDRALLSDSDGSQPNQLQVVNRFYAELTGDEDGVTPPQCVLLTETSAHPGRETAPVPGIPVTLKMAGSLEHETGPALAFVGGFYSAIAAGLSLQLAVSEGRASAAFSDAEGPF